MGASINSFTAANLYLTTVYKLQYPTIDNITDHLNSLGEGAQLFKIYLSRAFRQLRIDPRDYNLLTMKWGGGSTKLQLQSIIGSLMFVAKCVKPTRYFVNRLLNALREAKDKTIKVNEDMKRDLKWFMDFLPRFNGTATYKHPIIEQSHTLAIDACLTGVGGVWQNKVYTAPIPDWLQQYGNMHITHFEMINIIIAIKLWGNEWVGQKVILYTDNEAVVTICNQGFTRDTVLATIARNIWLYTAEKDICLQVLHLPGKDNVIADLLSRWGGVAGQISKLQQLVKNPQWCMVHEDQFKLNTDI